MISEKELSILGDYFVSKGLQEKGWTFDEFVNAYQVGIIVFN